MSIEPKAIRRRRSRAGFTMVEALIAAALLAVSAAGLFASFLMAINAINDYQQKTMAVSILQEEIEELRDTEFSSLPAVGTTPFANTRLTDLNNAAGTITVDQYDSDLLRITAKITWSSRLQNTSTVHTKSIVTLFSNDGM